MEIKPLLVYLQAGDYPEVLEPLKDIPCDKLILKYMAYPWPHDLAREFFRDGPKSFKPSMIGNVTNPR